MIARKLGELRKKEFAVEAARVGFRLGSCQGI